MARKQDDLTDLIGRLGDLPIEGASFGGPYVGVSHNEVTREIVARGPGAVPLLVRALETSNYAATVWIVFCLRELKAKEARETVRALARSDRFWDVERDLTLDQQLEYFERDAESW